MTPKGQVMIKEGFPVLKEAQSRAASMMGADCRDTLDTLLHGAERLAAE
mgnify:CR=1 FL=1